MVSCAGRRYGLRVSSLGLAFALFAAAGACAGAIEEGPAEVVTDWGQWQEGECLLGAEEELPDYLEGYGCLADFQRLATRPLDGSIPGARSAKTVIDTADGNRLYFLNAEKYPIHYDFCVEHLGGEGHPPVADKGVFNQTEYFSPDRRFWLGAITFYEGPQVWTYEIAPYDTLSAPRVAESIALIRKQVFFAPVLRFHPTSDAVERLLDELPAEVPVVSTEQLFAGVTFVPLNPAVGIGELRFIKAKELESGKLFVTPRDVVVLDLVPNDIPVVAGIITDEMQTPLSHVNVLSQNRGTPNMALRGAATDPALRKLAGKWVRLTVTPFDYKVEQVTQAEADSWWQEHKPEAVAIKPLDLSVTALTDVAEIGVEDIPAFGGKASHYGELYRLGPPLRVPKAFAIPVYYYKRFEEANGFDHLIEALLASPDFAASIAFREAALRALREEMEEAPMDAELELLLAQKLAADFDGHRMRFRSSTNAEDLDGFTGAGLYTSSSGDPEDPTRPVAKAIRTVWASLWNLRAFEERSYRGIDHRQVGMAVLVHRSFVKESSNGVALTNNIFDVGQAAFYINVQLGDVSVVRPPLGIVPDQFLFYYAFPDQPTRFMASSSLMPEGESVLTRTQMGELAKGLYHIHKGFSTLYAKPGKFYAMDVEFKFEEGTELETVCIDPCANLSGDCDQKEICSPQLVTRERLWVKQARPHYGWSAVGE